MNIVKEFIVERGFPNIEEDRNEFLIGRNNDNKIIYVKIYDKLELNNVKEFLSKTFEFTTCEVIYKKTEEYVLNIVIICKSFQKSHLKEFNCISDKIQLINKHFFNVNITKTGIPKHKKVTGDPDWERFRYQNLPIIRISDPVCIFYNFKLHDLIHITRSNGDIACRIVKL